MSMNAEARFRLNQRIQSERKALPAYPRDGRSALLERKLRDRQQELEVMADTLDSLLEDVADDFTERFAQDDARAATQARISGASPTARNQAERTLRRG